MTYRRGIKSIIGRAPKASEFNRVAENLEFVKDKLDSVGAIAFRTSGLSLGSSGFSGPVPWQDTVYQEPSGMWSSGDNTKIFVPEGFQYVSLIFGILLSTDIDEPIRISIQKINSLGSLTGEEYREEYNSDSTTFPNAFEAGQVITPPLEVIPGESFRAHINSQHAGALTLSAGRTFFSMELLG